MNHSKPQNKKLGKHKRLVSQASRIALLLAFLAGALLFTTKPFSVEGKRLLAAQGKTGEMQVQGVKVEGVTSAVVNFEELARQQALNPHISDPSPRAIAPPKTIDEVDSEAGKAEAPNLAAPVDIPSPLIPSPAPATNFAGLSDIPFAPPGTAFFTIPPDTTGAVSPDSVNRVFTTLNNNYRIQDKTGTQIGSDVSMTNFWAPVGAANPFDPRVQYDPYNDRWILAGVSNAQTANTSILVGISQTSDPGGSYFLFRIPARTGTDAAATNFADFPMLGFNKNWVVVSINMFATTFVDGRSLVIDYPSLRAGTPVGTYFTGVSAGDGGFCMHPATTYSPSENTEFLVAHVSSGGAGYRVHTITGTSAAPVFTIGAPKVRPGGGWVQPGGNQLPQAMGTCATPPLRIESGDAFVRSNVVFRNSSIWYPQTVGLPAGAMTHTAVQWTQLDNAGNFLQGGRVDDPTATATNGGKWRAYSSISVNSGNDVLLGFSEFESDGFASAGYTYRDHTDAAGTMRDPLIFKAGEDCYSKDFSSGRNRWGDYSHTMVDPTNDCNFWTIQEYAKLQAPPTVGGSTSKWGTWWAKVTALTPCVAPPPVIAAAGATLVTESCPPANNAADPGERVTVNLKVMNNGGSSTTNLVGTLLASANVVLPSGPQNYGAIAPGGMEGRDFSFTVNGSCGETITLNLQLQDGATNLGTVSYTLTLGSIANTAPAYTENFDGVTAPALPAGWTTLFVPPGGKVWNTTTSFSDTAPNSAATIADVQGDLTTCTGGQGGSELISPTIVIPNPPAVGLNPTVQLRFRNFFNLEPAFDGGVLEISINGGLFQDIIAAGGSFASGGYNDTLGVDPGNPLSGRAAWSGNSGGFTTTLVNLPASAHGQNVQFKWRTGYDGCFTPANAGMRIDTISIFGSSRVCTTPCGGVRLVTSATLTCVPSGVQATVTVSNTGTLPAANVMLTTARLGATNGTPLPQSLGTINPGSAVSTTVNFATSGGSTLTLGGTYTGGTFSSTKRVSISCSPTSPPK